MNGSAMGSVEFDSISQTGCASLRSPLSTDVLSAAARAAVAHTSVQAGAAANGATAQRLHDGAFSMSGWRTQRA